MTAVSVVASELLDHLHAQLPSAGFRLDGNEVLVGELVDLEPELLRAALSAMLPGIEVKVTAVAALLKCKDCGAEYPHDEHPCPVCGSPNAELIHGNELEILRAWGQTVAS
jgi:Zn finger protein HypA/HybF involved in hydrogenase expression